MDQTEVIKILHEQYMQLVGICNAQGAIMAQLLSKQVQSNQVTVPLSTHMMELQPGVSIPDEDIVSLMGGEN